MFNRPGTGLFILALLLATLSPARGSDALASDYIRADFTVEDGLPDNVVNDVVQTQNGLLWVGTQAGLASFDGHAFTLVRLQTPGSPAQVAVNALLAASDGSLWVATDAGLVRIPPAALDRNPQLLDFYPLGNGQGQQVMALHQDHHGVVWAATAHGLYREDSGKFSVVIPAAYFSRIGEALNGNLLLVSAHEFVEWDGRQIIHHPGLAASLGVHDDQIFDVYQDRRGIMWYGTSVGIFRRSANTLPPSLQPAADAHIATFRTHEDPQGQVWLRTEHGIYLVTDNTMRAVALTRARSFFAASDGELWIGTNGNGLIHLKRRVVQMVTAPINFPASTPMAVLSSQDGTLWVGGNCGLFALNGTRVRTYAEKDGLLNSCVWSVAEEKSGAVWFATYGGGVFRFMGGHFTQYALKQGLASDVATQLVVARDNSLWVATGDGISHLQAGQVRNYTMADGLSSNHVSAVYQDRAGTIWAATQGGINRLAGERFIAISSASSADGTLAIAFYEDSLGDLWVLNSPRGISILQNNRLETVNEELHAFNMLESPQHDLWLSGNHGVMRVRLNDLRRSVDDHEMPLDYEVLGRADGMDTIQCSVGVPNMAITPDNKLWIATVKGLAVLDLAHRTTARVKPKVFVGGVTIGKNHHLAGDQAVLPPGTHHVELHMEAVDLASPEKIRLQYRLDGVDAGWLDADASRTAIYTSVPVGTHAFHVRASGSDGVWDHVGIVYDITQNPFFYQTIWFRIVTVCLVLLLLFAAYLIRVRAIVGQTQMRLEERLVERERIARELHDTLLQGVLSAAMQLDVAEDQLPDDSPTRPLLARVLQTMRQVTEQGRNALQGLRSQDAETGDLALAFARIKRELAADDRMEYRVISEGAARPLRPQIRDEAYRIGREAILNALMHSHATSVEVDIEYASSYFRILVGDNGRGIDPSILASGRAGHWGLPGMRERSEGIGASLKLRSRVGAGTEIELIVPAALAFVGKPLGPLSRSLGRLSWNRSNPLPQRKRK